MRALLLAALASLACSGHYGPTEPLYGGEPLVTQSNGTAYIVAGEGLRYDAPRALAYVERGLADCAAVDARARSVSVDNLQIVVASARPLDCGAGLPPAIGCFRPPWGPISIVEGREDVIAWEVRHYVCVWLGRPEWCRNDE